MALDKATADRLSAIGFDVTKLVEAVKSESEVSVPVPELFTKDQTETIKKNRFEEGKTAMSEIKAKELKEKFGVDVDGKDIEKVIEAAISAKVTEATKGSAEWMEEKKQLQGTLKDLQKQVKEKESEFENKLFIFGIENELKSVLPKEVPLGSDLIVKSYFLDRKIKKDNDRVIVEVGGQVLKDNLLNPIDHLTDFKSWLDQKGVIKIEGKEGGDDKGGGSTKQFKSISEFNEHCIKVGVNPTSQEGQALLKDNKAANFTYE